MLPCLRSGCLIGAAMLLTALCPSVSMATMAWPMSPIFDVPVSTRDGGLGFALNRDDTPAVTYQGLSGGAGDLVYALKTGDTWSSQVVQAGKFNGQSTSLTFQGNTPHIAYRWANSTDTLYSLNHATFDGNDWDVSTIYDTQVTNPRHTDIRLDANGRLAVAWIDLHDYLNFEDDTLDYAFQTVGGWVHEEVAQAPLVNGDVSLRLNGTVADARIGWVDSTWLSQFPMFSERSGGSWSSEPIADGEGVYCAMDLDPDGKPHLAWMDALTGDVMYAYQDAGSWVTETIYDGAEFFAFNDLRYLDLSVDSQGIAHIVFWDPAAQDLFYAHRGGGAWITPRLLAEDTTAEWVGLEIDSLDRPHAVYFGGGDFGDHKIYYGMGGAVPEPSTYFMFALGLLAIYLLRRRRVAERAGDV